MERDDRSGVGGKCGEVFSVVSIGIVLLAAKVVDEDYGGDRHYDDVLGLAHDGPSLGHDHPDLSHDGHHLSYDDPDLAYDDPVDKSGKKIYISPK